MDRITELHLILDLIKKHNLPLSPILEYAIQEKEAEYSGSSTEEVIIEMKLQEDNSPKSLAEYVNDFATLSVAVSKGKKLPHKAILLLSIIQMIEDGDLANNMIPLDNRIAETFARTWDRYFNTKAPCVWTPFYHLKGEAFGKMRPVIKFAYFDEELYSLMDNAQTRNILRNILIENYLL